MKGIICLLVTVVLSALPGWAGRLEEATSLMDRGEHRQAADLLIEATGQVPATADELILITRALTEARDYKEAVSWGKKAIAAAPEQSDAHLEYARAIRVKMQSINKLKAMLSIGSYKLEAAQDNLRRAELTVQHAEQDAGLEEQKLQVEMRNHELELERQRLVVLELERQVAELTIRAPVGGLVSRVEVEDRDAVLPNQPLITVVDLSAFEVEISIPQAYTDEVGPGTPALVHVAGEAVPGRVKSVSPEVESNHVKGTVAFEREAPDGLRQNQRVSTRLVLESKSAVLKVPRGPFLEVGGGREAYVVRGDLAVLSPLEIGSTSISEIEIVAGLEAGDRIIISDTARFESAQKIYLRR